LKQRDEYLTQRDQLEAQTQTLKTQTQTLKENVVTQGGRIEELGVGLETLKLGVEEKILEIETLKLQHAQDLGKAESKFQETAIALVNIEEELNKKTSELEGFKGKSEERKKLITALEVKNDTLNQEKGALEVKIATLNTEINETSQKLEDSEGDRGFLEGELLRLQEEKAKLVKQMNDVEFLTAQYRRIKSDIAVAKRLDWMRRYWAVKNSTSFICFTNFAFSSCNRSNSPSRKPRSPSESSNFWLVSLISVFKVAILTSSAPFS
jgi:chromosome segregation ATPase